MLNNVSIRKRLGLVLGVILLLSLGTNVLAVLKLNELGVHIDAIAKDQLRVERAASEWLMHITSGVQRAAAIARSRDPGLVDYFADATASAVARTAELQKTIEQHMDLPNEVALFEKVASLRKDFFEARQSVDELKKKGDAAGALKAFSEQFEPRSKDYVAGVMELAAMQQQQLDAAAAQTEAVRSHTTTLLLASGIASLAFGAALAWLLSRSIVNPLNDAEMMARAIAVMDLTGGASRAHGDDETGRLLQALDAMRAAL